VAYVDGATVTDIAGCSGDWKSAWARPRDGRIFLGAANGMLATTTVLGSGCETATVAGVTSSLNGLVGFERGSVTTVYAVTSSGHVLRWAWRDDASSAPMVAGQVAATLRDVHGLGENTLLAVGAEEFQGSANAVPRAFRFDTASGQWARESLPGDLGVGVSLRGVHVVDGRLAYAVGDAGLALERTAGTWRTLARPGGAEAPDLLDVVAFGSTTVFAVSRQEGVHLHHFDGNAWQAPYSQARVLRSIDGIEPRELWAAGDDGTLVRWGP
jgi:hypothetical protein